MLHIRFVIVIVVCVLPFPALLLLIIFVSVLMLLLPSVPYRIATPFRDSLSVALLLQPAMAAAQAAEAKHRGGND